MAVKDNARFILNTYELPQDLEKKLIWIASKRFNERSIHDFDSQYRYIADLVDLYTRNRHEWNSERLDSDLEECTGFSPSSVPIKPYRPRRPDSILENEDNTRREEILVSNAIDYLEGKLSRPHMEFLRQLISTSPDVTIYPGNVYGNVSRIQKRLDELSARYQRNGTIVLPKRQIKEIQFEPFSIHFQRRQYHGNPLQYFQENHDHYNGMSRYELFQFDQGLYCSLKKANQLHLAIPHAKKRRFHGNPLKYFQENYEGMSRSELFQHDRTLYGALTRANQLHLAIPHTRKRRFHGNPLQYFQENYNNYRGISRSELFQHDQALYAALRNANQLHLAIPHVKKQGRRKKAGNQERCTDPPGLSSREPKSI